MSSAEDFFPSSATSLRHRKSKVESELQLLHNDHRKTTKHRWSNCFAFILKRCKFKSDPTYSSSSATNMALTLPCDLLDTHHINTGTRYPLSEKPMYRSTLSSLSPPPTPVSSPLSPPPRHIMTSRQQRQQCETKNMLTAPLHALKSTTVNTLPTHHHHHQQRRHPYRPHVLRLSLNMDQRYSYTSSIDSSDTHHHNIDDPDDLITVTAMGTMTMDDLEPTSRRQQGNNHRWTMGSFSHQPIGLMMLRDDSYDGGNSKHYHQISQEKEHYDAIVAASKWQHRRRLTSTSCYDNDNDNDNDNEMFADQLWNTKLDRTSPPSAPPLSL
ncbi:hypothetical protein BCR42DRAFT_245970 [Absidia repens]|uniref:Uncharacterized protein n=1 Tax=Absidia repens TaxID=90262 RepID=A0A1X2IKM4_9FUNG|nr:hypothetical protein BCR42DRAFT_245970 [Absidia repens]